VIDCEVNTDGLVAALREAHERQADLAPILRAHGKEMRAEAREIIDSGEGMPPLAESTVERRSHVGKDRITQHGAIRASVAKRLVNQQKRLEGLKRWHEARYLGLGRLASGAVRDKIAKLERSQERLKVLAGAGTLRQIKAQRETLAVQAAAAPDDKKLARKLGAMDRLIARRSELRQPASKLLGRLPSTLFYTVKRRGQDFLLLVASRWNQAGVHNDGDGHVPRRRFLTLTQRRVDLITRDIVRHVLEPLRGA